MTTNYKEINNIIRHWFNPEMPFGTISDRVSRVIDDTVIRDVIDTNPSLRECVFSQINIYSSLFDNQMKAKYRIGDDIHE